MSPTVVLIHGAYADSSSWNDVIEPLARDGYRVIACASREALSVIGSS
jgi:pimeloyl-ACP methyl ester carboxylesterase